MGKITRRFFLRSLPPAAVAAAVPAVALAVPASAETPLERVDRLLAELKVAIREANPNARLSKASVYLDKPDWPLPLMLHAGWATGSYQGDGIYAQGRDWGDDARYRVTMLPEPIRGERGFSVKRVGERNPRQWMRLSESELEVFIGRKVRSVKSRAKIGGAA